MRETSTATQEAKKIFISAVSFEFYRHRKTVASFVKAHGYEPIEQTQFDHTDAKIEQHLEDLIKESFAVICIIGEGFGSKSHRNALISFTQLEYEFAIKHEKLVYVLVADNLPKGKRLTRKLSNETPGQKESQECHLRKISKSGKTYYPFKDSSSFSEHVNGIIATINRKNQQTAQSQKGTTPAPAYHPKAPKAQITLWWLFDWLKSAKGIGILAAILAAQALFFSLWNSPGKEKGNPPDHPPKEPEVPLGGMQIVSTPTDATIYNEKGVVIGKTPFEKSEIPPGEIMIEIGLPGYASSKFNLEIVADEIAEKVVTLEKEKDMRPAKIELVSTPLDAEITDEGGKVLGKTPAQITIESGPHEFTISKQGFKTEIVSFNASPGGDIQREVVLSKSTIRVQFETDPVGATVFVRKVGGPGEIASFFEKIGITPCEQDLEPAKTEVEFTLQNYQSIMLEKDLSSLNDRKFFSILPPLTGAIELLVEPATAKIMEGDEIIATGSYKESDVALETRKFFVSARGFEPQEVELTIIPGETVSKSVELVEIAQYQVVYNVNDSGTALRSAPVVSEDGEIATLRTQSRVYLQQTAPVKNGWVPVSISGWLVAEGGLGITARRIDSTDRWKIVYDSSSPKERYIWLRSETSDETDQNKLCKVWKDTEFQVIDEYRPKPSLLWIHCIIEGWVAMETQNGNPLIKKIQQ